MASREDHQEDILFKINLNLEVTEQMELWLRDAGCAKKPIRSRSSISLPSFLGKD